MGQLRLLFVAAIATFAVAWFLFRVCVYCALRHLRKQVRQWHEKADRFGDTEQMRRNAPSAMAYDGLLLQLQLRAWRGMPDRLSMSMPRDGVDGLDLAEVSRPRWWRLASELFRAGPLIMRVAQRRTFPGWWSIPLLYAALGSVWVAIRPDVAGLVDETAATMEGASRLVSTTVLSLGLAFVALLLTYGFSIQRRGLHAYWVARAENGERLLQQLREHAERAAYLLRDVIDDFSTRAPNLMGSVIEHATHDRWTWRAGPEPTTAPERAAPAQIDWSAKDPLGDVAETNLALRAWSTISTEQVRHQLAEIESLVASVGDFEAVLSQTSWPAVPLLINVHLHGDADRAAEHDDSGPVAGYATGARAQDHCAGRAQAQTDSAQGEPRLGLLQEL